VSNVIDFLERFGGDAQLRHASEDQVDVALRLAGIEPALRAAIVSKDQSALEALLGVDSNVCCLVNKPEDEEEDDVEEDDEDDEDEDEDEDDFDDDDEEDDEDDDEDEDEDEDEIENVKSVRHVTDRAA
jgi:hypothetical protein